MADQNIAGILTKCESEGLASKYSMETINISSEGKDIFIVSDLHIAEGINENNNYSGTENFFYDESFSKFVRFISKEKKSNEAWLIINGDFIDFMRITNYPKTTQHFNEWKDILEKVGLNYSIDQLKNSISDKEKKYGLRTNEFKSLWKIHKAANGHHKFFEALAHWVNDGNKLLITKGNHDLELLWPAVRNFIRLKLAEIAGENNNIEQLLEEKFLSNILFADSSVLIDKDILVEHGHKYDKFSTCVGDDFLPGNEELNIPFGSFFNRYLLNRIELLYPYFDNVRPRQNILPLLFRERFFLGLKILFQHIPFMFLIIPKKYYRYMFGRVLTMALVVLIPLIFAAINLWDFVEGIFVSSSTPDTGIFASLKGGAINFLTNFAMFFISYLGARLVSYFQLEEPSSLSNFAEEMFEKNPSLRIITYGHTHNPTQFIRNGKKFFNTGTWIPIVEISSAEVRADKTYTFLYLRKTKEGNLNADRLMRWRDDSGEAEPLSLIEKDEDE